MEDELLVNLVDASQPSIIKVIGVGGGGDNAVGHMYCTGNIEGVNFLVCNTDRKALDDSPVPDRLQLGQDGLGAGGHPAKGRELAEESVAAIRASLQGDIKMVFITAGMGGGTGTGAAPVIAREAKARGILTVGIVTIPFRFEGIRKIDKALDGVEEMGKHVDALLVINNERLREIYTDLSVRDAFKRADDTLTNAVHSIVDIITMRGKMILDFRDVHTTLHNGGVAIMSTGYASGEGRVAKAIANALNSPLINNRDIYKSKKILMSIAFSSQHEMMVYETNEVQAFMDNFEDKYIETKYGLSLDERLGDQIKITILASGFGTKMNQDSKVGDEQNVVVYTQEDIERVIRKQHYYKTTGAVVRRPSRIYIYTTDALSNERLIEAIDATPTAKRPKDLLDEIQ